LHRAGDLSQAEQLYRHAAAADGRNSRALYLLGIARFQQGAPEEALEWIQSALEIEPASADALSHRGNVLHALGRLHEALESYDHALRLRTMTRS
jgi:tetratricopeptide (TPR) repeat protein